MLGDRSRRQRPLFTKDSMIGASNCVICGVMLVLTLVFGLYLRRWDTKICNFIDEFSETEKEFGNTTDRLDEIELCTDELCTPEIFQRILGSTQCLGCWDADGNPQNVQSGVGNQGDEWIVCVEGETEVDGQTGWQVGDRLKFVENTTLCGDCWIKTVGSPHPPGGTVNGTLSVVFGTETMAFALNDGADFDSWNSNGFRQGRGLPLILELAAECPDATRAIACTCSPPKFAEDIDPEPTLEWVETDQIITEWALIWLMGSKWTNTTCDCVWAYAAQQVDTCDGCQGMFLRTTVSCV